MATTDAANYFLPTSSCFHYYLAWAYFEIQGGGGQGLSIGSMKTCVLLTNKHLRIASVVPDNVLGLFATYTGLDGVL